MEKSSFSPTETQEYTAADLGRICNRAYELFEERGGVHGHDFDDWLKAEAEIRQAQFKTTVP